MPTPRNVFGDKFQEIQFPNAPDGFADKRRRARHDAAQNRAVDFFLTDKFFDHAPISHRRQTIHGREC